ncbi:MAG: hypothetical protein ACOX7F_07335 [Eubacteriales bacterium]|jgi:hypothetical protein
METLLNWACWILGGGLLFLYFRARKRYAELSRRLKAGEPLEQEMKEQQREVVWISMGICCCMMGVMVLN